MAYNRSWHCGLLKHEDNDYDWSDCEADDLGKVPVTLFICFFGLVGNGAVLWFLGSHVCRIPVTVYVLSLAVTNFTFLLSITIALVVFYSSGSFCDRLVSQDVAAVLKITIVFTFTASIYLLTAFSAVTSLSILPSARCHRCWSLPVLVCALLCVLSFLLTMTLYFIPRAITVLILSYLFSVLMLTFSGLTLLARALCCKRQHPPRELCVVVLLSVFFFPFFTADFGYWLFLRLLDFSPFAFNASLPLACANSTITPVIYFLAGSCASKFTLSVGDAFQRAFEGVTDPQNGNETPRKNTVEVDV
ncbi:mas-related G-protein coupled receptor member X2-like [Porphyrio hochstetteri]